VIQRILIAAVAVISSFAAVPASAQIEDNILIVSFGLGSPRTVQQWDLPVHWEGSVVVRFESGFGNGEIVWTPGATGQLSVAENNTRNGRRMTAFLGGGDPTIHARVESPTGICTDTGSGDTFDQAAVVRAKDGVRIGLAGTSPGSGGFHVTETQCGGPLFDDVGRALRMVHVRSEQLRKGDFDIDLRDTGPVNAPGIHASVVSTVVGHVGTRAEVRQPQITRRHGSLKAITVGYVVERVTGSLQGEFAGGGELCTELDSCGRATTLSLVPGRPRRATVEFRAYAPGARGAADLRAALGLPNQGGRAKGIDWYAFGSLSSRSNLLSTAVLQDGQPLCKDQRHVPAIALQLQPAGGRIKASLTSYPGSGLRTSCPGPGVSADGLEGTLASGSLPLAALRNRRITLRLTRGQAIERDGWSGRTRTDFRIVLRRSSVSVRHFRF
jgi:hypothetical protein